MPITDTLAFVHIPKTGGQSIAALMGLDVYAPSQEHLTGTIDRVQLTHLTAKEMLTRIPQEGRRWFTVVRNPWERAVSEYAYRCDQGRFPYLEGSPSFREFVEFLATKPKLDDDRAGKHLIPQHDFLFDGKRMLVREVYQFQELAYLGPSLFGRELPHVNRSSHGPWWQMYDAETERIIGEVYHDDVLLTAAKPPSRFVEG